jgi:hypothetical protein
MDATDSSAPAHPSTDHDDTIEAHDDTIEAHYASLERGIPCACYGGYHYIGYLVEGEDGQEGEVFEAVPPLQAEAVSELDAETFCEMLEPAGTPREG